MVTLNCTVCNEEIEVSDHEIYCCPAISEYILCSSCEEYEIMEKALAIAEAKLMRDFYSD